MAAIQTPVVSLFAQFVQGDIKGGTHAHAYRMATIQNAIEQLFKGNYSPITEAASLTEGKAKKARAYHAGFATFGVVGTDTVKVQYVGKLDSADNKPVRAIIEQKTHAAVSAFFVAFDSVMSEKPTPKAKTAPVTAAPAATPAPAPVADTAQHAQAVKLDDNVTAMIALLNNDLLTGAQLDELYAAVQAAECRAVLSRALVNTEVIEIEQIAA